MGELFKYIDDKVLPHYGYQGVCQWCQKEAVLYDFWAEDEEADVEASEVCVSCIKSIPLEYIHEKVDESKAQSLIDKHYPKGTKSGAERAAMVKANREEYRRTPRLACFVQGEDWPDCCGDFAEYIGTAGSSYTGSCFL